MKTFVTAAFLMAFSAQVFAGGISGGGGGTVVPDPAGTEFIKLQLSGARISLLMLLKNESFSSTRQSLFQGSDNIIEKVKNNSLKILEDKPCLDFDGKPNDASINSDPNTICISAYTIGQKVSKITDYPQILALLAHEYSHLMGYNESDAEAFQVEILYKTRSVSETDGYWVANQFVSNSFQAKVYLMGAELELAKNRDFKAYTAIQTVDNISLFPYQYPFRALDKNEASKVDELALRIKNLRLYSCTQNEPDMDAKQNCATTYDMIFHGADEVTAADFSWIYYGNTELKATCKIINLMKNPSQFKAELISLQSELQNMADAVNLQLNLRN